jgi:hypothetical protein
MTPKFCTDKLLESCLPSITFFVLCHATTNLRENEFELIDIARLPNRGRKFLKYKSHQDIKFTFQCFSSVIDILLNT